MTANKCLKFIGGRPYSVYVSVCVSVCVFTVNYFTTIYINWPEKDIHA